MVMQNWWQHVAYHNNLLTNHRIGTKLSTSLHKRLYDSSIRIEQIIPRHAWLSWHTSGYHHHIRTGKGLGQPIIAPWRPRHWRWQRAGNAGPCGDVRQVRGNSWCAHNIVAGEFGNLRRELAEEGEGLANATRRAEDGHLGFGDGSGGEAAVDVDGAADGLGGESIHDHGQAMDGERC